MSVALCLPTIIWTAKALVTACIKFEHPGRVERMFQLCRSCDGSAFEVFIAVQRIACQELFQNVENIKKIAECQIRTVQGMVLRFRIELCTEFRICCAVGRAGVITWRTTLSARRPDFCPDGLRKSFNVAQYWSALAGRPCAGKSTSSTMEEAKDTVQHVTSKWCHRKLSWGVSTPLHRAECFVRYY